MLDFQKKLIIREHREDLYLIVLAIIFILLVYFNNYSGLNIIISVLSCLSNSGLSLISPDNNLFGPAFFWLQGPFAAQTINWFGRCISCLRRLIDILANNLRNSCAAAWSERFLVRSSRRS